MESSDDDAGSGMGTSRQSTAREKESYKFEEVSGSNMREVPEITISRDACNNSEENSDRDSIISLAEHSGNSPALPDGDLHHSTEAILDMIDEFVDGPNAPKRRNLSSPPAAERSASGGGRPPAPAPDLREVDYVSDVSGGRDSNIRNVDVAFASCSATEPPSHLRESKQSIASEITVSVPNTCERKSGESDSKNGSNIPDRTANTKIDESNIRIDALNIETVECTSSDTSVSVPKSSTEDDSKLKLALAQSSPVRRKLVRPAPAPAEKRADTTVTSTMDRVHICSTSGATESVEQPLKMVSSSSDLLCSNSSTSKEMSCTLQEISISQEQSDSPSSSPVKKIKLVRNSTFNPPDVIIQVSDIGSEGTTSYSNMKLEELSSVNSTVSTSDKSEDVTESPVCNENCILDADSPTSIKVDNVIPKNENATVSRDDSINSITKEEKMESFETSEVQVNCTSSIEETAVEASIQPITPDLNNFKLDRHTDESSLESTPEKNYIQLDSSNKNCKTPKLVIKPIRPPLDDEAETTNMDNSFKSITKLNIKPIPKPSQISKVNTHNELLNDRATTTSSTEASESESSENDETSNSSGLESKKYEIQTKDSVPKMTIKIGKDNEPHVELNTEQHIPKLTIKTIQKSTEEEPCVPKLTLKIPQDMDKQKQHVNVTVESEKVKELYVHIDDTSSSRQAIPKLTIKSIPNTEPTICSPKSSRRTTQRSDEQQIISEVPKVTKLNIKPIVRPDSDYASSTQDEYLKLTVSDSEKEIKAADSSSTPKHKSIPEKKLQEAPIITKLHIKPIVKPVEAEELCDKKSNLPLVTKINIKPIINDLSPTEKIDSSITKPKIVIKPITKHVNDLQAIINDDKVSPTVPKLHIKPIVKPGDTKCLADMLADSSIDSKSNKSKCNSSFHSENEVKSISVMKLNIKPVTNPNDALVTVSSDEHKVIPKLTIKPLPKRLDFKNDHKMEEIPVVTKLNIKPVVKPHMDSAIKTDNTRGVDSTTNESPLNSTIVLQTEVVDQTERLQEKNECPVDSVTKTKSETMINETMINAQDDIKHIDNSDSEIIKVTKTNVALNALEKTEKGNTQSLNASQKQCEVLFTKNLEITPDSNKNKTDVALQVVDSTSVGQIVSILKKPSKITSDKEHSNNSNVKQVEIIPSVNDVIDYKLKGSSKSMDFDKPLEVITTHPKSISHNASGQDSPRIILKINKTEQGSKSEIVTEPVKKDEVILINDSDPETPTVPKLTIKLTNDSCEDNIKFIKDEAVSSTDVKAPKNTRHDLNEKSKSIIGVKRGSNDDYMQTMPKNDTETSLLQSKRMKLDQLLSNASLTITSVTNSKKCPIQERVIPKITLTENKKSSGPDQHASRLNEKVPNNGDSKLQSILSSLNLKRDDFHVALRDINCTSLNVKLDHELDSYTTSTNASSESTLPDMNIRDPTAHIQGEVINVNEGSNSQECMIIDDLSQDPLDINSASKSLGLQQTHVEDNTLSSSSRSNSMFTPQPKKRGRPRKLPVTESPKLPKPALEERPVRSLRLTRERPAILQRKPRGRGRGRAAKRIISQSVDSRQPEAVKIPPVDAANTFFIAEEKPNEPVPEDPMSSRIKLPRLTEALDNLPLGSTPLTSHLAAARLEPDPLTGDQVQSVFCSEEFDSPRPKRGRGSRGGKMVRTSRGTRGPRRGRGRGGGRGALYMKETMGIYGRICGPNINSLQLFEEETCMMGDNTTPVKPANFMDEDSQNSVLSSTTESGKFKKNRMMEMFDSNKIWTPADVREYLWPPTDKFDKEVEEPQVMMIQEQVAMFLGVKSFKRRYPELKRRSIMAEERDFILEKGLASEEFCELGITAVDASDVLDIMLSDFPHKYEEYRKYQRERQLAAPCPEPPPPPVLAPLLPPTPKVEPQPVAERPKQDLAGAAAASASSWNSQLMRARRPHCVDLQSMCVHRARPAPGAPSVVCRPPGGFYPLALLPGQFAAGYKVYTPEQLRYFPLNTAMLQPPPAVPVATQESDVSEPEWGSDISSSEESGSEGATGDRSQSFRRKRLVKVKRGSEPGSGGTEEAISAPGADVTPPDAGVVCKACGGAENANKRYTFEQFLICSNCKSRAHPSCLEFSGITAKKAREYEWQCAECKSCCSCREPVDDDKMLFCDLCDRGYHIYCVGLKKVPTGRWHCSNCEVCKSCGSRSPAGLHPNLLPATPIQPDQWHHQTKKGPGGHRVFSHSLCSPCARAYRIGRYCPLCERSFIGPKGTMQLVICKLCDRQLHQECVRQSGVQLNVMDHTCGECKRGGITSRAAAVRLAPRTIATLFMAKRRFNSYANKQYGAARAGTDDAKAAPDTDERKPDEGSLDCDVPSAKDEVTIEDGVRFFGKNEAEATKTEEETGTEDAGAADASVPSTEQAEPLPSLSETELAVRSLQTNDHL